jgi:hypothetical protein
MPTPNEVNTIIDGLTKAATERGELIRLGWLALRRVAVPPDAPPVQVDSMEEAFYAGAQHLFSTVMRILDPGTEPTLADLRKMDQINAELERFLEAYKRKHGM